MSDDNAKNQAAAQFDSIREMVDAMKRATDIDNRDFDWEEEADRVGFVRTVRNDDGDDTLIWTKEGVTSNAARYGATEEFEDAEDACRTAAPDEYLDEDDARQRIEDDALSVEVRSDWHTPGSDAGKPSQYRILLCTGGPACQIIGDLSEHGEPESATIQYQDWGTPWTDWRDGPEDQDEILLTYARVFYWGE